MRVGRGRAHPRPAVRHGADWSRAGVGVTGGELPTRREGAGSPPPPTARQRANRGRTDSWATGGRARGPVPTPVRPSAAGRDRSGPVAGGRRTTGGAGPLPPPPGARQRANQRRTEGRDHRREGAGSPPTRARSSATGRGGAGPGPGPSAGESLLGGRGGAVPTPVRPSAAGRTGGGPRVGPPAGGGGVAGVGCWTMTCIRGAYSRPTSRSSAVAPKIYESRALPRRPRTRTHSRHAHLVHPTRHPHPQGHRQRPAARLPRVQRRRVCRRVGVRVRGAR